MLALMLDFFPFGCFFGLFFPFVVVYCGGFLACKQVSIGCLPIILYSTKYVQNILVSKTHP